MYPVTRVFLYEGEEKFFGEGFSRLTAEAIDFLAKYERYREDCYEANRRIYTEIFSK